MKGQARPTELFVESRLSVILRMDAKGHVETLSFGMEEGIGVTEFQGRHRYLRAEASLRGLSSPSLSRCLRDAASEWERIPLSRDFAESLQDVIAGALSGFVGRILCDAGMTVQGVLIANSAGVRASDRRHRLRFKVSLVGNPAYARSLGFAFALGGKDLAHDQVSRGLREVAEYLLGEDLTPPRGSPRTGEETIVFSPRAGGAFVHEVCGHAAEADLNRQSGKDLNLWHPDLAQNDLRIIDDPSLAQGYIHMSCDDQGSPIGPKVLLGAGVTGSLLSLADAGGEPGGNARRQGYRSLPLPRMSNTYLAPTPRPVDVIAATGRGLYVDRIRGGQVDVGRGMFTLLTHEAREIREGRLGRRYGPCAIVGDYPASLARVDIIGADLSIFPAVCAKLGQVVPVGVGSPTFRVQALRVV